MLTLDGKAGTAQKELGLYATELNNQDFVNRARAVAREISRIKGSVSIDEVRCSPDMTGWTPSSPNTWGVIFIEKGWHMIGYEKSAVRTNRARRIGRWVYRP